MTPAPRSLKGMPVEQYLSDPARKQEFVTPMFDIIASRYDAFTRIFSFGMDRGWKRELIAWAAPSLHPNTVALDLACGTGDLAFALSTLAPGARITGIDASERMILGAIARQEREEKERNARGASPPGRPPNSGTASGPIEGGDPVLTTPAQTASGRIDDGAAVPKTQAGTVSGRIEDGAVVPATRAGTAAERIDDGGGIPPTPAGIPSGRIEGGGVIPEARAGTATGRIEDSGVGPATRAGIARAVVAGTEPITPAGTTRGAPAGTVPSAPAVTAPSAAAGTAPSAPAGTAPSAPAGAMLSAVAGAASAGDGGPSQKISSLGFRVGDLTRLAAGDASVDVITAGYAFRNVPDVLQALREAARVLKPGGYLYTLDFYRPAHAWWRTLFLSYLSAAGNTVGWLWHGEPVVYGYIAHSINHFVSAAQFSTLLNDAGFTVERVSTKLLGGIALHAARRVR